MYAVRLLPGNEKYIYVCAVSPRVCCPFLSVLSRVDMEIHTGLHVIRIHLYMYGYCSASLQAMYGLSTVTSTMLSAS